MRDAAQKASRQWWLLHKARCKQRQATKTDVGKPQRATVIGLPRSQPMARGDQAIGANRVALHKRQPVQVAQPVVASLLVMAQPPAAMLSPVNPANSMGARRLVGAGSAPVADARTADFVARNQQFEQQKQRKVMVRGGVRAGWLHASSMLTCSCACTQALQEQLEAEATRELTFRPQITQRAQLQRREVRPLAHSAAHARGTISNAACPPAQDFLTNLMEAETRRQLRNEERQRHAEQAPAFRPAISERSRKMRREVPVHERLYGLSKQAPSPTKEAGKGPKPVRVRQPCAPLPRALTGARRAAPAPQSERWQRRDARGRATVCGCCSSVRDLRATCAARQPAR